MGEQDETLDSLHEDVEEDAAERPDDEEHTDELERTPVLTESASVDDVVHRRDGLFVRGLCPASECRMHDVGRGLVDSKVLASLVVRELVGRGGLAALLSHLECHDVFDGISLFHAETALLVHTVLLCPLGNERIKRTISFLIENSKHRLRGHLVAKMESDYEIGLPPVTPMISPVM